MTSMTQMSNTLLLTLYTPTRVRTMIMGAMKAYGHLQELRPHADEGQVQDQQHDVADVHGGDDAPEDVRVLLEQERPRRDAVDQQGREDHRRRGVSRDAEGQERNEGRRRRGVVGRLGPRDPLDGPVPELLGVLRDLLLDGVGDERRQDRAAAGQDADEEADDASRAPWPSRCARDRPSSGTRS